jgi:hypothetical protein
VLTVIVTLMTITGRSICSVTSYFDNHGDVKLLTMQRDHPVIVIMLDSTAYKPPRDSHYCHNNC